MPTNRLLRRHLTLLLGLTGCVVPVAAQVPGHDLLVSSRGTSSVKRYDGVTGAYRGDLVMPGSGGLSTTQEVRLGPDGKLYVTGRGNSAVLRYDPVTGAYLDRFTKGYTLDQPTKMTFIGGNLYVSQWGTSKSSVAVFDATTGQFLREATPNLGQPMQHLLLPGGDLLVSRFNGSTVLRFGADGSDKGAFTSGKPMQGPVNLAVHPNGDLLVMDWTAGTVERFDIATGAFKSTFIGGLANPEGWVIGPDDRLYIAEWTANRVSRFNKETGARIGTAASGGGMQNPNSLLFIAAAASDFSLEATPAALRVTAGDIADVDLALVRQGSAPLGAPVTLACRDLPSQWSCAFSPASVSLGDAPTTVQLAIHTDSGTAALFRILPAGLVLLGLVAVARPRGRGAALLLLAVALAGCGGGGMPDPTDEVEVDLEVVATSGVLSHAVTIHVVVESP